MNAVMTSPTTALAEAHRDLLKDLADLERFSQPAEAVDPETVLTGLEELRAHLGKHFRFEEENGYMKAVLARAPQHERRVRQLREEHDALWVALAGLLYRARELPAGAEEFRQALHAWIEQVRNHEARENVLVEDTFNIEVAASD